MHRSPTAHVVPPNAHDGPDGLTAEPTRARTANAPNPLITHAAAHTDDHSIENMPFYSAQNVSKRRLCESKKARMQRCKEIARP
jgi:hypothetical protein